MPHAPAVGSIFCGLRRPSGFSASRKRRMAARSSRANRRCMKSSFSTPGLAIACMGVVAWWTPPEPAEHKDAARGGLREVLGHAALLRLDLGVFVLHAVQLAMWVAVPALLVEAGLAPDSHWAVYLPAVLASFVVMGLALFPLERRLLKVVEG